MNCMALDKDSLKDVHSVTKDKLKIKDSSG